MFSEIFLGVVEVFISVGNYFWSVLDATGAINIYRYVIYMVLSFRFILRPIFGWASSVGSDRADKKTSGSDRAYKKTSGSDRAYKKRKE